MFLATGGKFSNTSMNQSPLFLASMQKSAGNTAFGLTTDKKEAFSGTMSENPIYSMQEKYMKELSDNYDKT